MKGESTYFDPRLSNLLTRWQELIDAGQTLPAEELCAEMDCPDLVEELERRIEVLEAMNRRSSSTATTMTSRVVTMVKSDPDATVIDDEETELLTSPRYGSLRFHDKGGLGEVFVAEDQELHRDVALKFIQVRHAQNLECRSRFLIEAEITAQLEHPGVVPVYGVGKSADGRPFYAMRFIRGGTLKDAIERFHRRKSDEDERSVEFRNLLGRFVSVCNTLAYAHNRGIVHRDIKPQNIMLGKYSETLVVDWGLALPVDRDEQARASGELTLKPSSGDSDAISSGGGIGTPAYMSPEQAAGEMNLTSASDIFSLGATFYTLLVGKKPFSGLYVQDVFEKVKAGDFPPPCEVRKDVPRPLEAICLKAMAVQPEDRYRTALDLSADIENWLADTPVSAYSENTREKFVRWMHRHRSWTYSLAVTFMAIVLVSTVAAFLLGSMAKREKGARVAAVAAQEQGIRAAARLAATAVSVEIDKRWHILEAAAGDEDLRRLMLSIHSNEAMELDRNVQKDLQIWLHNLELYRRETTKAASWFVNDETGVQLARTPTSKSIGENFSYRSYFHGGDQDRERDDPAPRKPIEREHRSMVFESVTSKRTKVAFSIPIWSAKLSDPDRRVIGVLAMTVELGQFNVLDLGLGSDQLAVLVETRKDWQGGTGLILHHPHFSDPETKRLISKGEKQLFRLEPDLVERLVALREDRIAGIGDSAYDGLERNYRDPVGGKYSGVWLSAFEPVLVNGRPDSVRDTGWVVIVQERNRDAAE